MRPITMCIVKKRKSLTQSQLLQTRRAGRKKNPWQQVRSQTNNNAGFLSTV